ncbi:hypothetical protein GCM10011390_47000 [Aureimonas endophytica]|uniref:Lipoprotein n=1 Tax=Aureimonas endophytica TaxID=2027858 RepID=A0A917EDS2_9HYPH|nr:hypothetical protein [Aureimonas endophytica]GGE22221.1 hypothetical protein GCM10011390_47000 [Aureimonas endophytica]
MIRLAALAALLALAGCNTPYPDQGNLFLSPEASVSANRAPRGSRAFCETYARQTQDNYYESNSDDDSGFGPNAFVYRQAQAAGDAAYRRCLAGRTG